MKFTKQIHDEAALFLLCGLYPSRTADKKQKDNFRQRMKKCYKLVDHKDLYFKPSYSGNPPPRIF